MATYAPLLAHVDAWQWRPDLIWFDNFNVVRTPNYYVQKLYAHYAGTNVLPLTWNKQSIAGEEGLYASSVIDTDKKEIIVKIANAAKEAKDIKINLTRIPRKMKISQDVELITLKGEADVDNTIENPTAIVPSTGTASVSDNVLQVSMDAESFKVFVMKYQD
jgi:alpha-L-arabinofuranosidase